MTAPTEAEIRAYVESSMADWSIADDGRILSDLTLQAGGFEQLVASEHITDDDFGVYTDALHDEFEAIVPDLSAALRPLMVEAEVRAAVRFFEHYPDAPLAKQPVSAR